MDTAVASFSRGCYSYFSWDGADFFGADSSSGDADFSAGDADFSRIGEDLHDVRDFWSS